MKLIQKYFKTQKAAEKYLFDLQNKYNKATCYAWPLFSESGVYSFKVED